MATSKEKNAAINTSGHMESGVEKAASTLYHGSHTKIDVLNPRDDHGDTDVAKAVFATPSRMFSLAYSGNKWGCRDLEQSTRGALTTHPRMVLREMRPDAFKDLYETSGYLHHLPDDTFHKSDHRRTTWEVVSDVPVTPFKVEHIPNVLKALQANPDITLEPYDPTHYASKSAIKRQVKRMLELSPEGQKKYRNWYLEKAPPEMAHMFHEETTRQKTASTLRENFEEKVEHQGGKWHWTGSVNSDGYPKMKDGPKLRLASHLSLELAGRKAPTGGQVVLHKNNDPSDVNPSNLAISTQFKNLKQMRDQGRDRPRGVDQEPDVKKASVAAPIPETLWHLAPTRVLNKIQSAGIRSRSSRWGEDPRRTKDKGTTGNRAYFITSLEEAEKMRKVLEREDIELGKRKKQDQYGVVQVETAKVPGLKLHVDPEWPTTSVFATTRIPAAAVRVLGQAGELAQASQRRPHGKFAASAWNAFTSELESIIWDK